MGYNENMKNKLMAIIGGILAILLIVAFILWPKGKSEISDGLKIYAFEAGKADAFLIYDDENAILIDAGEKELGDTILEYLELNNISKLDYLIITHFDKDHVGSAAQILESIIVNDVLQSNYPKDSKVYTKYLEALEKTGVNVTTVAEDLDFGLGNVRVVVDAPAEEEYISDASNNSSLIVKLYYGTTSWLFMGDAEDLRLSEYLSKNSEEFTFLKVPYHGHNQAQISNLVDVVKPKLAVITSSDEEPEDDEVVSKLTQVGAEVFLTRKGAVLFTTDGENIATSR